MDLRKLGAYAFAGPVDVLDIAYWKRMTDRVQAVAEHQECASQRLDDAEVSTVKGRYDWRAYLREELAFRVDLPRGETAWDS